MGRVAVTYQLMPEETSFDMEALKTSIGDYVPEGAKVAKADIKPFAYGLKILEIVCVMDDANNVTDQTEERLRTIEGIQSVETTGVTLI
jgi:translation elongation factor aEF-1 beta